MIKKYVLLLIAVLEMVMNVSYAYQSPVTESQYLTIAPVDQVFKINAERVRESSINLKFTVANGFYLYKNRLKISTAPDNILNFNSLVWPSTLSIPDIEDPVKNDDVYIGTFTVNLPFMPNSNKIPFVLSVTIQGCDGKSICYPPQTYTFDFNQSPAAIQEQPPSNLTNTFIKFYHGEINWQDLAHELSIIQLIIIFFIAGIAIALTPCMYPLYPIALTTIMGNVNQKHKNIILLVIAYVHGIAIIYVIMGIVASISGKLLTTVIQTPIVMFINAFIWLILGLAMFDLIQIKLPNRLHLYLHHKSNNLDGGNIITVFIMGIISSLLLGPCVTPPLIAAIGFITGLSNIMLGVICLYAISLGMGIPLLVLAFVGGRFLPKSGKWMNVVKYIMGILLIAVSISLIYPYLSRFIINAQNSKEEIVLTDRSSLAIAIQNSSKPILVDIYASWCVVCRKMDKETFSVAAVKEKLNNYTMIKFDITNNTSEQAKVLKEYGLYGPPALIILDKKHDVTDKLLGFIDSITLINHLDKNLLKE